jgi:hypothetical protein
MMEAGWSSHVVVSFLSQSPSLMMITHYCAAGEEDDTYLDLMVIITITITMRSRM